MSESHDFIFPRGENILNIYEAFALTIGLFNAIIQLKNLLIHNLGKLTQSQRCQLEHGNSVNNTQMLHLLKVHLLFHELSFLTNLAGNRILTFYHMHRQEGRLDVQTPMNPKVGHVYNIPTMQFLTFLNSVNILSYLLLSE